MIPAAIVRSMIHPVWARRDHPAYPRYRREAEQNQYLSPDDLTALQLSRLRGLLAHAYDQCPLYRERLDAAGMAQGKLPSLADLQRLPLLTKKDIQTRSSELRAKDFPAEDCLPNQTGGSTGAPVQFLVDKERFDSRMASTARHNEWAGYRPGDWCAHLWGARVDLEQYPGVWGALRKHLLYRRVDLNTSSIGEADWRRFIAEVRDRRPPVMVAYAQSAVLFAEYVRAQRIDDVRFRSIITTSEVLLPGKRELLEETFGGKVFNRYGCREVSVVASECDQHTGMHVNADALLVELVPDPLAPEGCGKVVVTDLLNRSMPLIRYEIGDIGRWAEPGTCGCGRTLPRLAELQGRITEFLVLPDGKHLSGVALLTWVFADMKGVGQLQFVQRDPQVIQLRVVPGAGYSELTRQDLRNRLAPYIGTAVRLEIEETASIPKEPSGKYRFVVNELGSPVGSR